METTAVSREPSRHTQVSNEAIDLGDPSQSQPQGHRVERRWLSHRRGMTGTTKELRDKHGEERSWSYHHRIVEGGGDDQRCTLHQTHSGAWDSCRGPHDVSEGEERWLSRRGSNRTTQETSNDPSSAHVEERSLLHRQGSRAQQGGRVLRNRRYRRPFDDHRHTKRLFTPEIKKFLKDWLVRRRDHPYPNRDEKKRLAVQTGLTYIQICNWFANWRRKLKNAGDEQRTTWGHLIKSYNTQAQGNVEQFSICSDDSIWEQQALNEPVDGDGTQDVPALTYATNTTAMDHSYSVVENKSGEGGAGPTDASEDQPQCFQVTSTTTEEEDAHATRGSSKYKSHIMEKYLRDLRLVPSQSDDTDGRGGEPARGKEPAPNGGGAHAIREERNVRHEKRRRTAKRTKETCPPKVLSKWLESAAKFQPTKSYVPWTVSKKDTWRPPHSNTKKTPRQNETEVGAPALSKMADVCWASQGHHREELDAAEALTRLSGLQH